MFSAPSTLSPLANEIKAGLFHHMSSIAVAGNYEGVFREDMFDEAEASTTHTCRPSTSEGYVREHCTMPWRAYRPAIVLGDSKTGEIDKIDGPYYFFKAAAAHAFDAAAVDAHGRHRGGHQHRGAGGFVGRRAPTTSRTSRQTLNKRAFHLTDPAPTAWRRSLNIFARAAHAADDHAHQRALFAFIPSA